MLNGGRSRLGSESVVSTRYDGVLHSSEYCVPWLTDFTSRGCSLSQGVVRVRSLLLLLLLLLYE